MGRIAMRVLWPAFLAACLAEAAFFALFDPAQVLRLGDLVLEPAAVYTAGFFFFWVVCALASVITYYLVVVPDDDRAL